MSIICMHCCCLDAPIGAYKRGASLHYKDQAVSAIIFCVSIVPIPVLSLISVLVYNSYLFSVCTHYVSGNLVFNTSKTVIQYRRCPPFPNFDSIYNPANQKSNTDQLHISPRRRQAPPLPTRSKKMQTRTT